MQSLLQYRRLRRNAGSKAGHGGNVGEPGSRHKQAALADPHQWSYPKRIATTSIVFILVFALGWNSTCDSNVNKEDARAFHVSEEAETLPTALFFLGISLGSLVSGPISETVGRNPVYLISTSICICFTLGSALAPNFGAQLAFRFLSGLASSPTLSMYGGSLADMFSPTERATVWPIFALSPIIGPALAPVAGGWISSHIAWRWVYWIALLLSVAAFLLAFLFLPETFSPILQDWRSSQEDSSEGDSSQEDLSAGNKIVNTTSRAAKSFSARLWEDVSRPTKFFTSEPIIICLGVYLVIIYVVNFTFLSGFGFIFTDKYGLAPGITSLAFISIVVGALLNTACTPLHRAIHKRMLRRYQKQSQSGEEGKSEEEAQAARDPPELRLIPAITSAPLMAISLFWLGWTNYQSISPLSAYFATGVFGFSLTGIFVSSYQYIIDSYESYSSSALASITMARYFVSAGMIVATRPMFKGMGVHWTLTFLGILATILVPAPYYFEMHGKRVRERSAFAIKD